jgi:hypothetical protein
MSISTQKSALHFHELTDSEEHLILKQHYRDLYNKLVLSMVDGNAIPLHPSIVDLPSVIEVDGNFRPAFLELKLEISSIDLSKLKKGTENGTYLCPKPEPLEVEAKKEESQVKERPKVTDDKTKNRPQLEDAHFNLHVNFNPTINLERINLSSFTKIRDGTYLVTKGQESDDDPI